MLTEFLTWLQNHPTTQYIGFTAWFPFLESIHVVAIALVVGSIVTVDLRLLGWAALRYPASRLTRELLPWTWAAFLVAAATGAPLFATRATAYAENPAFQAKFVLLALAGLNMVVFQFWTSRGLARWDESHATPPLAKIAGGASLVLWVGVVLAGRWTGHII